MKTTLEYLIAAQQWLEMAAVSLNHDHTMCDWDDRMRRDNIGRQREKLGKATVKIIQVKEYLQQIGEKR